MKVEEKTVYYFTELLEARLPVNFYTVDTGITTVTYMTEKAQPGFFGTLFAILLPARRIASISSNKIYLFDKTWMKRLKAVAQEFEEASDEEVTIETSETHPW